MCEVDTLDPTSLTLPRVRCHCHVVFYKLSSPLLTPFSLTTGNCGKVPDLRLNKATVVDVSTIFPIVKYLVN